MTEKYRSSEDILAKRVLTTKYNGNQRHGNSPTDGESQVSLKGTASRSKVGM